MGNELGAAIKAARNAKTMRQQELADALGVKQATISAWEIGQNTPDGPTMLAIGRLLGVSFGQSGMSADAAYALGQASGELRAIGEMAEDMARRAYAAADRVAVPRAMPSPSEVEAAAKSAKPKRRKAL